MIWDACGTAHRGEVVCRLHRDGETVLAQVVGIAVAALAARVLVQGDLSALRHGAGIAENRGLGDAYDGEGGKQLEREWFLTCFRAAVKPLLRLAVRRLG